MTIVTDDSCPDIHCDVCGSSTRVLGHGQQFGTLQAHWGAGSNHGGERYEVHLCEPCFFLALATLRQEHRIQHLFDETEPDTTAADEFGLVARDDFRDGR